ncbi:MAG: septum formation initiator family protein [Bacillales bacterium]
MGAIKQRKVTKIQSPYMEKHEEKTLRDARRKKLLIRRLTVFSIFAGIISYVLISSLISQHRTLEEMNRELLEAQEQLAEMKKQEEALRQEIVKLNDDEYLAKLARKELYVSKDGEIIFTIPDEKKEKDSKGQER